MSMTRHHCRKCHCETLHQKCACIHCGTSMFDKPLEGPGKASFGRIGLKKPITKRRT